MCPAPARPRSPAASGHTLVELVAVVAIAGVVALLPAQVLIDSLEVYSSTAPRLDAAYQAHLAADRLTRDFRDLASFASITTMDATALTFDDSSDVTHVYTLDGTRLLLGDDTLATGVSDFSLTYLDAAGEETDTAIEIALLEIDLTVTIAGQGYRARAVAHPRDPVEPEAVAAGSIDVPASVATAVVSGNHFDFDLTSLSEDDLVVESFELSVDRSMPGLKELKFDNGKWFKDSSGYALPTGETEPNYGDVDDRTVEGLDAPVMRVMFKSAPSAGASTVTLVLNWTSGDTSTLVFELDW